jgi:hypothetical protein
LQGLSEWLESGTVTQDSSHVHALDEGGLSTEASDLGKKLAQRLKINKAILGIFDEGCMGMYKRHCRRRTVEPARDLQRASELVSALAEMQLVTDEEANSVSSWLDARG